MHSRILKLIAAVALSLTVQTVTASIIDLEFTGNNRNNVHGLSKGRANDVTFTVSDLAIEVRSDSAKVHRSNRGFGVAGGAARNNLGRNENLVISFSEPVRLLSLSLFELGLPQLIPSFMVTADGQAQGRFNFDQGLRRVGTYAFQHRPVLRQLELRGLRQGFRLNGLSVATEVPAPTNLGLMLIALAGMVVASRRRAMARV